jgi:hypothetical protein
MKLTKIIFIMHIVSCFTSAAMKAKGVGVGVCLSPPVVESKCRNPWREIQGITDSSVVFKLWCPIKIHTTKVRQLWNVIGTSFYVFVASEAELSD